MFLIFELPVLISYLNRRRIQILTAQLAIFQNGYTTSNICYFSSYSSNLWRRLMTFAAFQKDYLVIFFFYSLLSIMNPLFPLCAFKKIS